MSHNFAYAKIISTTNKFYGFVYNESNPSKFMIRDMRINLLIDIDGLKVPIEIKLMLTQFLDLYKLESKLTILPSETDFKNF